MNLKPFTTMADDNLVEGWDKDMSISDISSDESDELKDNGSNEDFYFNEIKRQPLKSYDYEDFVTDVNIKAIKGGIDFCYIHDQDMSYYRETDSYYLGGKHTDIEQDENFNRESMLGRIEVPGTATRNDDYDPQYDEELNNILGELEEELEEGNSDTKPKDEKKIVNSNIEQFEDYYDEFPEDEKDDNIYEWYELMSQKKIREVKRRLGDLSTLVCYASASTREQIIRIERDHNTPFCQLDFPRHPPLNKPWINYWRFNCAIKCGVVDTLPENAMHAHTPDCEMVLLEHVSTGISTKSKNIIPCEFPEFVMHAVELFQEFINVTSKEDTILQNNEIPDSVYERPTWSYIKLRSNYKNELMLIASGKGITPLLRPLMRFFRYGPGRSCNIVSVYCINVKWSQKKGQFQPTFLTGLLELRDKVGPISLNYNAKTNVNFNSIEAQQLGRILIDYLSPTPETTLIDIGCGIGVLSLILAQKCEKVIGLNTFEHEVKLAENIKLCNKLHNASFLVCHPKDIQTKCAPLVKKCITVAVLNLGTIYGKSHDVMKALRNLPSIWRVIIYGSFTKEFHKHITMLTSRDEQLGDEFLPMRGCMVDTFPTVENAFDIVILFERKSLIEPSIELIATGPTVNIKSATNGIPWKCKDEIQPEIKSELKTEKSYGAEGYVKKPLPIYGRPSLRYGKFDSPTVVLKDEPASDKRLPSTSNEKSSVSPSLMNNVTNPAPLNDTNKPLGSFSSSKPYVPKPKPDPISNIKVLKKIYDYQSTVRDDDESSNNSLDSLKKEPHCTPSASYIEEQSDSQSSNKPYVPKPRPKSISSIKVLRKIYDYQSAVQEDEEPSNNSSEPINNEPLCPSTVNSIENQASNQSLSKPYVPKPKPNPISSIKVLRKIYDYQSTVREEEESLDNYSVSSNNSSLPELRTNQYDNVVPLKQEEEMEIPPVIKKEPVDFYFAPMPKVERQDSDKEEGELSGEDDKEYEEKPRVDVNIKPEPMDLDEDEDEQPIDTANEALSQATDSSSINAPLDTNVKIKLEPINDGYTDVAYDVATSIKTEPPMEPFSIKSEPVDSIPLPSIDNLEDFENMPTPVHTPAALAKQRKAYSPIHPSTNFTIDGFEFSVKPNQTYLSDVKIKIKPDPDAPKQQENELLDLTPPIVSVKTEPVEVKEEPTTETDIEEKTMTNEKKNEDNDDEISVIKVKSKKVKKEHKSSKEKRKKSKEKSFRKLEEKRMKLKMQLERDQNYRYDDSPSTRRTKSPMSRYDRRPLSPIGRRTRSPLSPVRRSSRITISPIRAPRSPRSPPFRRVRSPLSPYRRDRSPLPTAYRYRSPPSPSPYRRTRSPGSSPPHKRTRSPFDQKRRYRRSPPAQYRLRSPSPTSLKHDRSFSPYDRSKSPFDQKRRYRRSPPSPYRSRYSRYTPTSPPPPLRSKYRWIKDSSPTVRKNADSLTPSPPTTKCTGNTTLEFMKKLKKLEKEPEIDKVGNSDDQWDIPGLSSLESELRKEEELVKKPKKRVSNSPTSSMITEETC